MDNVNRMVNKSAMAVIVLFCLSGLYLLNA
jgi:hypothetical protein